MAMIKCSECGKEISSTAEMCPHCGSKTSRGRSAEEVRGYLVGWILAVGLLFVGLFMMATNIGTYNECVQHLEYYEYFSDSEKGAMQTFGFGLILFLASIVDMCVLAYKAKQVADNEVSAYPSNGGHADSGDLEWECPRCYYINRHDVTKCTHCGAARGGTRGISAESVPTWKRIQMEEENQRLAPAESKENKCIFCGAEMAEGQLFCGACGRRKD